jgi:preprotein translocase subunit SecG
MEPEELRKYLKTGAIIGAFFVVPLVCRYALHWGWALVLYAVLVGIASVLAILIQSGRGGGLATTLGGLGGDSLLGTHSATPIAKATYVMLALFLFTCVLRATMTARTEEAGPLPGMPAAPVAPAPAAPAVPGPAAPAVPAPVAED